VTSLENIKFKRGSKTQRRNLRGLKKLLYGKANQNIARPVLDERVDVKINN